MVASYSKRTKKLSWKLNLLNILSVKEWGENNSFKLSSKQMLDLFQRPMNYSYILKTANKTRR